MKYLVTGGAGFIGSNLATRLVEMGEDVTILDDFSTGRPENIAHLQGQVQLIRGDIRDLDTVRKACEGVSYVLHQAALPSVPRSVADPLTSNSVNVNGTLNVLLAAKDSGVLRVVLAASSSAYGDSKVLPKVETMAAKPRSPYAVSKYAGELYAKVFFELYGLETVCLRYFNVFGPRQDPSSQYSAVIPKFIAAYLSGTSPLVYGDGGQTRDFTYIDNVVEANLLACHAPLAAGHSVNIACGEQITLNDLAFFIRGLIGKGPDPTYGPARAGDVRDSLADISLARQLLGYTPLVEVREGLKKTVEWYRRVLAGTTIGMRS